MRILCLLLFSACLAVTQSTNATLSGTVTDSTDALVPSAKVSVRHTKTGVQNRTESNAAGVYLFASLPPGPYEVNVERTGFTKVQVTDLILEVGGRTIRNVVLQVGNVTETLEVRAESISLNVATSSVGGVISGENITTLPLIDRNTLELVYTQAGVVGDNFGGSRAGAVNVTLDGINVQDNRYNSGVSSVFQNSTDAIAEVRIVTSPADAEFGRGSGQIQMVSKSGANQFHGALFEQMRNRVLNANNFFNNLRGRNAQGKEVNPRDFLIQNQFGGNVSGPITRNRTFFFFLTEANRVRSHETVSSNTYTATARQGLYRFFTGARNANAGAAAPSVDFSGNPIRPDVQTANLFGRDPQRLAADATMQKLVAFMPLPNDFRSGDGLNTAGYRWQRSAPDDLRKFQFRIDHNISERHRLNGSYNNEHEDSSNTFMPQAFPTSPIDGRSVRGVMYSLGLVSTLRANLINEFHAGAQRVRYQSLAPWQVSGQGILPTIKGQPFLAVFPGAVASPIDTSNDPQGRFSPVYQASDSMTWLKGKHSVKGGVDLRFVSSNGFNSFGVMPRATIGAGAAPVTNINTIAGIGNNAAQAQAQNLLNVLSGSFSQIDQSFNSPGGANPQYLAGEQKQRTWRSRELSWFLKDDFRLTPSLLLNIGVRYEYYGVPYDSNGKTAGLVGGSQGIFGISGTTFADMFSPGKQAGSLTNVEQIGPNSPNSGRGLFAPDRNNFAPAVGLSWNIPKRMAFGRTAVFRTGYGRGYERHSLRLVDIVSGDEPGLNTDVSFRSGSIITPSNATLPLTVAGKPLSTVPVTERTQTIKAFDSGLRQPYVQNWNATLEFELTPGSTLDIRYVGSKGTRLLRGTSVNEVNIVETGVLDAFKSLQAGGCPALINRMSLNCTGFQNATFRDFYANNNVGDFATYLNTSPFQTNQVGGLLRRAGLPENFLVANPQFAHANLIGNFSNSTYHSLQLEFLYRAKKDLTLQSNLTYSKLLGDDEGDTQDQVSNYRTLRNLKQDRRLLDSHRTYVIRTSGHYELPFGPGKKFLSGKNGLLSKVAGGWSTSVIWNIFAGAPMDLYSYTTSFNDAAGFNTVTALTPISNGLGQVTRTGNGVVYFPGLKQVADPSILSLAPAIQGLSSMLAIADASGKTIVVNPLPGQLGSLAPRFLSSPGGMRLDVNLRKKFQIKEGMWVELRADAQNFSNTPYFDLPVADINDPDFGRITSAAGNRIVVVGARIQF